jgi:hypothetical protein
MLSENFIKMVCVRISQRGNPKKPLRARPVVPLFISLNPLLHERFKRFFSVVLARNVAYDPFTSNSNQVFMKLEKGKYYWIVYVVGERAEKYKYLGFAKGRHQFEHCDGSGRFMMVGSLDYLPIIFETVKPAPK